MIRAVVFFVTWLTAGIVWSQVNDISKFDTAKERIQNYLLEADGVMDSNGVIFQFSKADAEKSGNLQLSETTIIQIANSRKKLQYSSNQTSLPNERMPDRSESLWFDGKLKCKGYLVSSPKSFGGEGTEIERDPSKTDEVSKRRANYFGPFVFHMYLDPYGLPLASVTGLAGTLTSVDNAVRTWVTKWDPVDEDYTGGRLVSRWISGNKNYVTELVFEDKQGGMPVMMRRFGVDRNLNQLKGYICETRTTWVKVTDGDKWIPKKVTLTDDDQGGSRTINVDIDFIPTEKVDDVVTSVNWKELHEGINQRWYSTITERLRVDLKGVRPGVSKIRE